MAKDVDAKTVRKILLKVSDEGAWTATFIGDELYSPVDVRQATRALELEYRHWTHRYKLRVKAARAEAKVKAAALVAASAKETENAG